MLSGLTVRAEGSLDVDARPLLSGGAARRYCDRGAPSTATVFRAPSATFHLESRLS